MEHLQRHIEALIFASQTSISLQDITASLGVHFDAKMDSAEVEQAIDSLMTKYQGDDFAIEVVEISGGFTFMTKGAYHATVGTYLKTTARKKLSKAALETLSIIAYTQPCSKSEIESIRGVNCDYSVQKLLEKDLVEIKGRGEGVGRPLLYGTSDKFVDFFGLKDIKDLPNLQDIAQEQNSIGTPEQVSSHEEE